MNDREPPRRHASFVCSPVTAMTMVLLASTLALVACGSTIENGDNRLVITVSILPQQYFVQALGGDLVSVNVMVEPGANPATYEPRGSQMRALANSGGYVSIGVPFEDAWLDRISAANPGMLMIDSNVGIDRRTFPNGIVDPHIWLSPRRVEMQAQTIAQALIDLDPDHSDEYQAKLEEFREEVEILDRQIKDLLAPYAGGAFVVSHPSWGYFAEDYALEMVPIEVGGQEPSAAELADLVTFAQRHQIKVVFGQPEFSTQAAEIVVEEIGGKVVLIDPLAEDWAANLLEVSRTLAEVLSDDLN